MEQTILNVEILPLIIRERFNVSDNIETMLDETDKIAEETDVRFSHDEVFSRLRGVGNV